MTETAKQQSSPFSTGGGGTNFETRIQAAFTVLMLSGGIAPCLPPFPIVKLKFQGHYVGFNTDDFIVFSKQPQTEKQAKLLAQIKHDINITPSNRIFAEVIHGAWNDFKGDGFDPSADALALITGPLTANDIDGVRPILEWAKHSENEDEFLSKINTDNFSSDTKRKKLEVFKVHLKTANDGIDVSNKHLWEFLKTFHLISYDLDTETGSSKHLILSIIKKYSNQEPLSLWARIVDVVQTFNQDAGTLTLENLPEDLRTAFSTVDSSGLSADVHRLKEHGKYILFGIRTTVGKVHVRQSESIAKLLDLADSSSFVLVSGERGSGKSSLIRTFSDNVSGYAPIFCLRTEDLDKPHLDNVFSSIGLKVSLGDLEAYFALIQKKYLIIESLEKLLELGNTTAFVDLLHFLKIQRSWTVIATCRDYAYQQVIFNFLQPIGINFETLNLYGFSDDQVQSLCEQLEPLQKLDANQSLKQLLKIPFYADLAYKVLETGTEFIPEDGEREFKVAVWRYVIAKEQVRKNGMPITRKQTFMDIAVKRAKQMVYGVPVNGFNNDAIQKLEEDNLVHYDSKKNFVIPAHDVLEDWALEEYIENVYRNHSNNLQRFLDRIGHEPAMGRAFRLWLHQKLKNGENFNDFVHSILNNQDIQRYWQDETIAAVLQGNNPDEFLELLKNYILLANGELLKRFCFILRIACKIPDNTVNEILKEDGKEILVNELLFKPYGNGWKAIIRFLYKNRDCLSKALLPHITAVLNDWTSLFHLDKALPPSSREAGLLAIHLLDGLKEAYRYDGNRKKLLSVIIRSISVIHEEFVRLLEIDVFVTRNGRRQNRPHYSEEFCEMAFSGIESAFLCKHSPDIIIKLAHFEWFTQELVRDDEPRYGSRVEVAECFGLHEHRYTFFPASGLKGPFWHLLYYHPQKGLDFIIDLFNKTTYKYAHSDLDHPNHSFNLRIGYSKPLIEQIKIQLNDGSFVKQYYSDRLWSAYRGYSVAPYLLQSALMAFENWLIFYTENFDSDKVEWLFDYILRNSNSVMPTSVLASIATGFPEKVGKSALPLLRTPELYFMDLKRSVDEIVGIRINRFFLIRDPLSELYAQERRTAALRHWRRESLETLVSRLQFSVWRDETLAAIDMLRKNSPDNEKMRFLLHRIDSRGWKPVVDNVKNTIIFEPEGLEPDLKEIQQKTQEAMGIKNRFSALNLWAVKNFKYEPLENDYYTTWHEALVEAKELFEKFKTDTLSDLVQMYYGGFVTAAAVFMRDHSSELTEEDILWCADLIIHTITVNADTYNNSLAVTDVTDHDGAAAAANILSILLDFSSQDDDKLKVKNLIVTGLTHENENVRNRTADGIREHLWQRDTEFAKNCVIGAIAYARFEKDNQFEERRIYSLKNNAKKDNITKFQAQKDEFRDRFTHGQLSNDLGQITLQTHSSRHILTPCLMIPDGSTNSEHIALLSQMLALFFEVEQNKNKHYSYGNAKLEIDYRIKLDFTERFAKYLFHLHESGFEDYIEKLRTGCETAPNFMNFLVKSVSVEAEKKGQDVVYWQLWKKLSQTVQKIAIEIAQHNSDDRHRDDRSKLIRCMLQAEVDWQKTELENQYIEHGKDLILEFVTNTGKNPDVFESLAKLMYYFPSIFFESGIHILSKHQREEGGIRLLSEVNTVFYLERSIQRFLQIDQTGPLQKNMHDSCFILIDAIVETASSQAYYLREHLIRSRRIL